MDPGIKMGNLLSIHIKINLFKKKPMKCPFNIAYSFRISFNMKKMRYFLHIAFLIHILSSLKILVFGRTGFLILFNKKISVKVLVESIVLYLQLPIQEIKKTKKYIYYARLFLLLQGFIPGNPIAPMFLKDL